MAIAGEPSPAILTASDSSAGGAARAAAPSDLQLSRRLDSEQPRPTDSQAPDGMLQGCQAPHQPQAEGPLRPGAAPGGRPT